jgi:HECT-like Ubiquitin-conjugating enzyme (E2)-binding
MPGAGTLQGGPAVHAEVLGNIQSLLVVVNEPYSPDKYTLTSTSLLRDQTSILPFPTAVYPQDFKPQNVNENAFSVRLRLAQNTSVTHDSETTILSAKDLKDIATIKCRECNATLSNKAFPVVKDLPSEHWMELVECWICHETSEKEHSGKLQPIMAHPNLLLVSNTYLLFHPEDVKNVKLDSQCPPVNVSQKLFLSFFS